MELKESIMKFIVALHESGIPVLEDEEVANIIYEDLCEIVESAKLVGVNEVSFSQYKKLTDARNRRSWKLRPVSKELQNSVYKVQDEITRGNPKIYDRLIAHEVGKEAARAKAQLRNGKHDIPPRDPKKLMDEGRRRKEKYNRNKI